MNPVAEELTDSSKKPAGEKAPIRVLVIDDDPIARRVLATLIAAHTNLSLCGQANSTATGRDQIAEHAPDAIFLDIRLGAADSGFDLLERLENPPRVVFVTSSEDHPLDAFEVAAVDYLLKPVTAARFAETVRRLDDLFSSPVSTAGAKPLDRICLRSNGATRLILFPHIVAVQANGNFSSVLYDDGRSFLTYRSLHEFEKILPAASFARLDRSLLINLDRLERTDRISRDLSKIWLRGWKSPLDIGRTASAHLRTLLDGESR